MRHIDRPGAASRPGQEEQEETHKPEIPHLLSQLVPRLDVGIAVLCRWPTLSSQPRHQDFDDRGYHSVSIRQPLATPLEMEPAGDPAGLLF